MSSSKVSCSAWVSYLYLSFFSIPGTLAQDYYIRGGGYLRGPLAYNDVVDLIRSGSVEQWYDIAEVDPGTKPKSRHYAPANTTPFWLHHRAASAEIEARLSAERDRLSRIILTTETATALPVTERLGIITAECAFGMNIFRDLLASVRDAVGGRSGVTQNVLRDAKDEALMALRQQAFELEADAVVAVGLDYTEFSGGGKSMLVCIASGTAVKLDSAQPEPQSS